VILQDADATYAIRAGDWKLIERLDPPPVTPRSNQAAERQMANARNQAPAHDDLFDLAKDPGETADLHADHPEVVARLRKQLAEARERGHTR
jgi:arylsulfatase A